MPVINSRAPSCSRVCAASLLAVILMVAAALRLSGANWDDGHNQHPDERFMVMVTLGIAPPADVRDYFDTAHSTLNPYNRGFDGFAYGTLPVLLVKGLSLALDQTSFLGVTLLGRAASAAFDLGTVLLVFLLGAYVFGRGVGLLAAAFAAVTVLQIQLAHFYTVDSFLGFFTTLTLLFAYRTWWNGHWRDAALMGLALGFATATKLSGALLVPIVAVACAVPCTSRPRWRSASVGWLLLVSLGSAFIAFRLAEPYAFLGPGPLGIRPNLQFVEDMRKWVKISSGEIEVPYMVQWARTAPYLYPLRNLVQWGTGIPLGLCALGGALLAAAELRDWHRSQRNLLLVAWTALCLAYFGGQFAKFLRYLLPVYPALVVLAAYGLLRLWGSRQKWRLKNEKLAMAAGAAPIALVLLYTSWYAVAFATLYSRPHSRIVASEWIYLQIPQGSVLAEEHWDDQLPLSLPGRDSIRYRYLSLNLYDDESPKKTHEIEDALDQADYVVLASNRLVGSIPRIPERYPLASAYYKMLFQGQLGFAKAAVFTRQPSFLRFSVDDSSAPEDLTVYEHPTVTIFRKTDEYSAAAVARLLESVTTAQAVRISPLRAGSGSLVLTQSEREAVALAGTWSELFPRSSAANELPLLFWLALLEAIGLVAFPLVWTLFPHLPDHGWTIGKVLALVFTAYVAWLLQSLAIAPFGPVTLSLALLLIALSSAVLGWRRRTCFTQWVRENLGSLVVAECVFLATFALMLAIRLANPDLWQPNFGGEKPMDFAYFNAVLKSAVFPPYDPWFAGGYINYYYYGYVLAAVPTRLLGIVPAVAYNLLIPTFFALLCAAVYGLVQALVLTRPHLATRTGRALSLAVSIGGVLLVGVLGDLDGMLQLAQGFDKIAPRSIESALPLLGPALRVFAALPVWFAGGSLPTFDFWRPTRIIGPEDPGPITEFPFFTFLYGDLHAHLLALPLTVTVLAVALNAARSRADLRATSPASPAYLKVRKLLPMAALLGLLIGTLRATNTWDFPIYFLAAALGLSLAVRPRAWNRWRSEAAAAGLLVGGVFALSTLLFAPYLSHYQLFYTGFDPAPAATAIGQFLTIHGLSLFLVVSALALEALLVGAARDLGPLRAAVRGTGAYGLAIPAPPVSVPSTPTGLATSMLATLAVALYLTGERTAAFIVGCSALVPVAIARRRFSSTGLLVLGMTGLAFIALLTPEIVTLQGDIGRMNTVFKFHLQAWVLLAIVGATAWAYVARKSRRLPTYLAPWRGIWAVVLLMLLVAAATYPLLATPVKTGLRFANPPEELTLDGMAYLCCAHYEDRGHDLMLPADYRALLWMQDNIQGTPGVAEGNTGLYRWGSRVSIYTGLPTIIGWDWHQRQQRWGFQYQVEERLRDVKALYEASTMAAAWPILQRYRIEYIYVGGLERAYYPAAGLEKFDHAVAHGLSLVYQNAGVSIYRVEAARSQ